jgi:predicted ribosome quality control (RQC) complex YloA/Tae2 family protein
MDSLFLEAVVAELQDCLVGASVSRIHQPFPEELVFKFWTGRDTLRLLVAVTSGRSRIHLTAHPAPNPPAPARFCQLLRARLSRLVSIEQVPGERVVAFLFRGRDGQSLKLMAELTGRHGNLVLVDGQGKIIDALKRLPGEGDQRAIMPGEAYRLPPGLPGRLPESVSLPEPIAVGKPEDFESWLLSGVRPMSRLMARDLAAQVGQGGDPQEVLQGFVRRRELREYRFLTAEYRGNPVLSAFDPKALKLDNPVPFPSSSSAADAFYAAAVPAGDSAERRLLQTVLQRALKRLERREANIEEEQAAAGRGDEFRRWGELLLAHLHRLRPGMTEATLDDYYEDPPKPVVIPLDSRFTPRENAEKYFRRYKKIKRGREHLARRMQETAGERSWLEGVVLALEESRENDDLAAIRRELVEGGLLRAEPRIAARNNAGSDPARRLKQAVSPGGYRCFWGTSNRVNDYLTTRLCRPQDLWFHAQDLPGCHLVLKKEGREEVPEEDQLFAASLAAGYSRGKNDGKVAVMVTEGKWVQKPKAARPGLVTVRRFRTLLAAPRRLDDDSRE